MRARRRTIRRGGAAEETGMYATGASAAVETTGLAVQALLKWGEASATARKALAISGVEEGRHGRVGNDAGDDHGAAGAAALDGERRGATCAGTVEVLAERKAGGDAGADGRRTTICCTSSCSRTSMRRRRNNVEIRFDGKGGLAYQVAGRYFMPWTREAGERAAFDRRERTTGRGWRRTISRRRPRRCGTIWRRPRTW